MQLDEKGQLKITGDKSAITPDLLKHLKEQKEQLIALLKKQQGAGDAAENTIPVVDRNQPLQLSYAQQRLWFIEQLDGGKGQYNMPGALELNGHLKVDAFKRAIETIIERHAVLRSTYETFEGSVRQNIHDSFKLPVRERDLTSLNAQQQQASIHQLVLEDAATPFDLANDVLLRSQIIKLAEQQYVVLFNMHHIASDGWSMGVLIKEIAALYTAYSQGQANPLPPLPIQYVDFAHWQRSWLSGDNLEKQLNFWRDRLSGAPLVHNLPLDKPRPKVQQFNGGDYKCNTTVELTEKLNAFCKQQDVTLFMLLQTAFAVLIGRYSREQDIVMGTPIAGRSHHQVEDLIGFFINTLVLRTTLTDSDGNVPTFTQLLQTNKEPILSSFEHQHVPFEMLVEELNPGRSLSHSPLFQIMFTLQNNEEASLSLPDLTLSQYNQEIETTKFDLTMVMAEDKGRMLITWEYCSDLFEEHTISGLANGYVALLESIVTNPDTPITELNLIRDAVNQKLVGDYNDTDLPGVGEQAFIHHQIEMQAKQQPDAAAVVFNGQTLSYAELNNRANQLANTLMAADGYQQGNILGICTERSLEMVIAVVAVLKAGCAYVPMDPDYPQDRLTHMVKDSSVNVILTQSSFNADFLADSSVELIALDTFEFSDDIVENPVVSLIKEDLAYVIYTSGSTGLPKGVLLHHGGFANMVQASNELLRVERGSKALQFASFAFDAATWDISVALSAGAELHIVPASTAKQPELLDNYVAANQLTHAMLTPALLPYLTVDKWQSVTTLTVGGDACSKEQADMWAKGRRFLNAYGPSECTVCACIGQYQSGYPWLHMGKPLSGYQLVIVDDNGHLVPEGAIGELCISGISVGHGYLNRPEQTADAFTANPFSDKAGYQTLYKTGDLVRWLPDGNLHFMGRKDTQVKIRGFRIELGEIESQLAKHDAIESVAVIIHHDEQSGQPKIVAWFTTKEAVTTETLRDYLATSLPDYMMPSAFMPLDSLPVTVNGKIDLKALQAMEPSFIDEAYVAPEGETETTLAAIFAELLNLPVERIGREANFFALGGHSLLAVKLISKIRDEWSVEIQLRDLFNHADLNELAIAIEQAESMMMPDIERFDRDSDKALPLSFGQQRLWFIDKLEGGSAHYNMPAAFNLQGSLKVDAFKQAVAEILNRHEVLRGRYVTSDSDGEALLVIEPDVELPVNDIDLTHVSTAQQQVEVAAKIEADIATPFDLTNAPLLRINLIKLADDHHVVLFNMHHIVSDGWSMGVMISEFNRLYAAFAAGEANPLVPLEIQYLDFAGWQRDWLQGDVLDAQLNYWKEQLKGIPSVHNLPLDHVRPEIQQTRGGTVSATFSLELSKKMQRLCSLQDITPFMLIETAFATLVARYSNETDIVVGSPNAGRHHQATESLIGLFVDTLVLRNDLSDNPTFSHLLQQNKQMILDAYANQHVPFEMLVDALNPGRQLSFQPLTQLMVNYFESTEQEPVALPDLTLTPFGDDNEHLAKTDMTLYVSKDEHQQFVFNWVYSAALFDQYTIENMAAGFEQFLTQVVENPALPVNQYAFASLEQQQQLLKTYQPDVAHYPETFIHHVVDGFRDSMPDQIALSVTTEDGQQTMTYGELADKSDELAMWLIANGVQNADLVGIYTERGINLIVGIMAIIKAGAGYVALAPDFPASRIEQMIEDATPRLTLADAHLQQAANLDYPMVSLDDALVQAQGMADNGVNFPEVAPDQTAHIIYTSGSTGRPKGVMGTHRSLMARVYWMHDVFPYTDDEVCCHITSVSFIRAVFELFTPLAAGKRIEIIDKALVLAGETLIDLVVDNGITRLISAPSLARTLVSLPSGHKLAQLKYWYISGEALKTHLADSINQVLPTTQVVNLYGSTEVTSDVSFYLFDKDNQPDAADVPIGVPTTNTSLLILDEQQCVVPDGMPGEIVVAGKHVSKGYLARPDLTEKVFVAHQLGAEFGEKLYRTGDRGRRLEDGGIEYLGRLDDQIKIRGFRIEPGEIESRLLDMDAVKDTRVLVKSPNGSKDNLVLVAYVIPTDTSIVADETASQSFINLCKQVLTAALPEYMVPGFFLLLDKFPQRGNGKVNRAELPEPDFNITGSNYVAPRNDIESAVAAIWRELLQLDEGHPGIHDNFFQIGGHSLMAMRLMAAIRQELNVDVDLRALFSNPTVAQLAELVESKDKQASLPALTAVERHDAMPLSYQQQRLWFLDQFEGGSAQYNIPGAFRLIGTLNEEAFNAALRAVIERHEVLRTNYVQLDEVASLVIRESFTTPVSHVDLSELSETQQQAKLKQLISDDVTTSFSLTDDVMVRATLIKLADNETAVLFNMHHIASDGWSLGVFMSDFIQAYDALAQGQTPAFAPLTIQYADYANWQRNWLQGDELAQQTNYWQQALAGIPQVHSLPLDFKRPAVQQFVGKRLVSTLNKDQSQALAELCQQQDVTLFMLLQSVFSVLLSRYSREADIVMGSPIAGREHQAVEPLIGFFVNTLVLRSDLAENPTFAELLTANKDMILSAYNHQHVPFETLVETLNPVRSVAHSPLFQIMFVLQNSVAQGMANPNAEPQGLGDLSVESLSFHGETEQAIKFDLELHVSENAQDADTGLELHWNFNTSLFDVKTIERFADGFSTLVDSICESLETRVEDLNITSPAARHQLIQQWNQTDTDYAADLCIHQLIEAQAAQTPDKTAVVFENTRLSYQELNERANVLAHRLIEQGVGPDQFVGLCTERSAEMLIGALAIFKAGGAYLPLDPGYPAERLAYYLEDSAAQLVLTKGDVQDALADVKDSDTLRFIALDSVDFTTSENRHNPEVAGLSSANLAYVIYTSGSTGKPKGVCIEQRALHNFLVAMQQQPGMTSDEKFLAVTSIGFDISKLELYLPLLIGAELHIAAKDTTLDGALLADYLTTHEIDVMQATPSTWQMLLIQDDWAAKAGFKVLCGGEAMTPELARSMLARLAPANGELWNMYGPTETTIWSSVKQITDDNVLVGPPIANTQFYVLDQQARLLAPGCPGELCIGGDGLARGYNNRADLTAEQFIPDPFMSEKASGRIYKTGDLVRWTVAGELEFLGRIDHQVKVRGFRIELGEIEAQLSLIDGVNSCAVLVMDVQEGMEKQLVAFVASDDLNEDSIEAVKAQLAKSLPEFMVPGLYVFMDKMPLTPNGKTDRKALILPSSFAVEQNTYVAPATELQQQLCDIWQTLLHVEQIGIHDNFFNLGGHSLLAQRLVGQIRQQLGLELPLKALFEQPTVAQLADVLTSTATAALPAITVANRDQRLPLSFAQQRLFFIDQFEGGSALYNIFGAIRLVGSLDHDALEQAFTAIADQHEVLRTTFAADDDGPYQVIHSSMAVPVNFFDLRGESADQQQVRVEALSQDDAGQTFNLRKDAMLRGQVIQLADNEHVVTFNMHHIASDGWSLGVFMSDFITAYQAISQQQAIPFDRLPVQYADFAAWQRNWLEGEALDAQIDYWREALAGIPQVHSIPLDHKRPATQTFVGKRLLTALTPKQATQLHDLCQRHDVTLFMLLQTAFSVLLSRYSRETDIVMGSPIAGRKLPEVEGLIGLFVNTLVLRSDLDDNPAFDQLLAANKSMILSAYNNQDVPFENLVEALNPMRSVSHSPLFQVMFILQNSAAQAFEQQQAVELGDLTVAPMQVDEDAEKGIKFDLELHVVEEADKLELQWHYNTSLFETATIQRMADSFDTLINSIIDNTQTTVNDLNLTSETAKSQLITQWNQTDVDYQAELSVHQLIEAQAAQTPDKTAVVFEDTRLSYQELNERANVLAHRLIEQGVGPDQFVGLCTERSVEMLVGALAIFKAGGAYLPLDPGYPAERLAYYLEDSAARLVLTKGDVQDALADVKDSDTLRFIALDSVDFTTSENRHNPEVAGLSSANLAYVIYTSGSTGKPKGVCIEQRALHNFLVAMQQQPGMTPEETFLAVTSIGFDISKLELYLPLLIGAELHIATKDTTLDGALLADYLTTHEIDVMQATPSTWQMLLIQDDWAAKAGFKVLCGGEAMTPELARSMLARLAPANGELWNMYGPTETTIWSSVKQITDDNVLVGPPIANTQFYVLDQQARLLAPGCPGELCIGGDGLARGYNNRADLTAEQFIPDPFMSEKASGRIYKTGDLVRWTVAGELEFLGRIDHQVKVRGFRIELGEIEAQLSLIDGVNSCAVLVMDVQEGMEKQLVAFVANETVASSEAMQQSLIRDIKAQLAKALPEFMVPGIFVFLDAMPLTPNGKIDRKSLFLPDNLGLEQQQYVAPQSELEHKLCDIWQQLLKVERVGIRDNFFNMGGHSLLAQRLVSLIRQHVSLELPLKVLFEQPTIEQISVYLAGSSAKEAIKDISVTDRNQRIPLSFAQQRLFFIDQFEGGSALYNMFGAFRLKGDLDLDALKNTFNEVVRRHEVLRTTYASDDEGPYQVIHTDVEVPCSMQDVSHLPLDERMQRVSEISTQDAIKPFDLTRDTMLRTQIVKQADNDHVVMFNMHHIASDGWSLELVITEFSTLYNFYKQGESAIYPLPELSIQYADFAAWQRDWLQGEALSTQVDYWKQQLAGIPDVHNLPLDKPRPAIQQFEGRNFMIELDGKLVDKLEKMCADQDVTLFMLIQTAFSVQLARYSNETDIVMSSPIAGRDHEKVESLIGFFINNLVLRSDLSDNPVFTQLLQANKQMILEAYSHQHVPFDMLVEVLQPARQLSYQPIAQLAINYFESAVDNSDSPLSLDGLELVKSDAAIEVSHVKNDMTLYIFKFDGEVKLKLEYATSLFEDTTIKHMAAGLEKMLLQIVENPSVRVNDIDAINLNEQRDILQTYLPTVQAMPEMMVPAQIDSYAAAQGDKPAIVHDGVAINYRELKTRTDQAASALIAKGVKPGDRVGLLTTRCSDMVINALAIVKAGAAYVPLASELPSDRIAVMTEEAQPVLVLVDDVLADKADSRFPSMLYSELRRLQAPEASLSEVILPELTSDMVAHIIFTSGSTGKPKGVMGVHGALNNRVNWMKQQFPFGDDDVCCHITSVSFIRAVWELFTPLAAGQTMHLINRDTVLDGQALIDLINREQISRIVTAPSLARIMVTLAQDSDLSSLKYWFVSGEALKTRLADDIRSRLETTVVCNLYGSTEVTSDVSFYEFTAKATEQELDIPDVPVGQAIANTSLLILDNNLRPLPDGMPGEICIAGANLAAGYLNQTDLTDEKFARHQLGEEFGERVYRTGDRGRRLVNGNIEYLGRLDDQVKIRGFRIEPGEIEAKLLAEDTVQDAKVVIKGKGEQQLLVAYIVPAMADEQSAQDDLIAIYRENLSRVMPEYMVPAAFMFLDAFPQRANGKVDRNALPEPDAAAQQQAFIAPRTATEKALADLWLSLLPVSKVGVNDNFFRLGGHSLLAMRMLASVRQELGANINLKQMFAHTTLGQLAILVDTGETSDSLEVTAITPRDVDQPLEVSYAQRRLWFIDKLEGGSAQYNMPSVFVIDGELDVPAFRKAIATIVERHEVLRTHFTDNDGEASLTVELNPAVNVNVHDLRLSDDDAQQRQILSMLTEELVKPFNLETDILLRAQLVRLAKAKYVVLFNMHHIASDGWSMGLLVKEFAALYAAFSQQQANPLQPLPVQYADYAAWQRNWLQGDVLDGQLGFWTESLQGLPQVHSLPLDNPRPAIQSFVGRQFNLTLDADLTARLNTVCQQQDVTLFMLLQTAFAVLMSRFSRETDIVMGSPIAGRHHPEVEDLIGFFVNNLVLRTDLNAVDDQGNPGFDQLLAANKDMILSAYDHQHVPFEMIVDALKPERSMSHTPLFQVLFAVQNHERGELELPGLTLSPLEATDDDVIEKAIKFDMELYVVETGDELLVNWHYAAALFDEATISRMANALQTMLTSIADNASQTVNQLNLVNDDAVQTLMTDFNTTAMDWDDSVCIHQLIERQVATTPDRTAVVFNGESLTYQALNQRANQLAHLLIERGIKPDEFVGICAERSADMLIAALAVFKAGAAYLPLDPNYPSDRLSWMLEDSAASIVLTFGDVDGALPQGNFEQLALDSDSVQVSIAACADVNPDRTAAGFTSQNLAYVIYTSGSTGKPKGVCIEHRSLHNFLLSMQQQPGLTEADKFLAVTSIGFDISKLELYLPLMTGAELHIASSELTHEGPALVEYLTEHHITVMQATPSTWQMMLVDDNWQPISGFKALCGGEAMPLALAKALTTRFAPVNGELWNMYGPTETTIWSAVSQVTSAQVQQGQITVGQGIANTQLYILDHDMNVLAPGCPGELCIGGDGLAREYLNLPDMTAERFADVSINGKQQRIYRTGDLARWTTTGVLEFMGRIDHQVKVRGFRIELGEIETHLAKQADVQQCAVLVAGEEQQSKQLVAFVVSETLSELDDSSADLVETRQQALIRDYKAALAAHMPDFMIPDRYVFLDEMPLTPNGKIDRKALPVDGLSTRAQEEYVAPRNAMEQAMCNVIAETLNVGQVGINDNFFGLGADSIILVQVVTRLKKQNVVVNLRDLFTHQSVAGVSDAMAKQKPKQGSKAIEKDKDKLRNKGITI